MPLHRSTRALAIVLAATLLAGCASVWFEELPAPSSPAPTYRLADWPWQEYWTGYVFNGERVGFSHLRIAPAADAAGLYDITSEASFLLRFLGFEKRFHATSRDRVDGTLALREFEHGYRIDESRLRLRGRVDGGALRVETEAAGERSDETHALVGPLYPTSALPLYPLARGLMPGRHHVYPVYDAQLRVIATAEQEVLAFERSTLFEGPAFKVRTRLHGHQTDTWISEGGLPVFELAMNGALISALEMEAQARRYLLSASLNKQETMLEFGIVRPDRPLPNARNVSYLRVALQNLGAIQPPRDARQQCQRSDGETVCEIRRLPPPSVRRADTPPPPEHLRSTLAVPALHPRIRAAAERIAAGAPAARERIARLVAWLQANVERAPVDSFSALDVLESRKAECQGHAYLYAALARALAIPTRVVNGLVYSEEAGGFLYHSWNESWVDGEWVAVDPTFGQIGVDATHIGLIDGETPAELLPLLDVIGRLKIRVMRNG